MINPKNKKQLVFPMFIPTNTFNGKVHTWNDVNADGDKSVRAIGAFGYETNQFLGGRCLMLGYFKEYGFWGCRDKIVPEKIRAFYLPDPTLITELGKTVLAEVFPDNEILYIMFDEIPVEKVDVKNREKLEQEAVECNVLNGDYRLIGKSETETLQSLVKAARYEAVQEQREEKRKATAEASKAKQLVSNANRRKKAVVAEVNA